MKDGQEMLWYGFQGIKNQESDLLGYMWHVGLFMRLMAL